MLNVDPIVECSYEVEKNATHFRKQPLLIPGWDAGRQCLGYKGVNVSTWSNCGFLMGFGPELWKGVLNDGIYMPQTSPR